MDATIKTSVIIAGAGPTGLSLACQLTRYGVDFVILEKNDGLTTHSKAISVHARTLEIYEQIGLAKNAVAQGQVAEKVRLLAGGEVRGELDLSNIGQDLSTYPYMLLLEQSKNERLLHDYLQSRQQNVWWQTELAAFEQNDAGVTAQVKSAGGAARVIEGAYLVGCDGPRSVVRHGLGLDFGGSTFAREFYVADAQVDWDLSHDATHICLAKDSVVLFFPLKGDKRYRLVGNFPDGLANQEGERVYEEIEERVKAAAEVDLDIHDVEWFSTYKVHTRHADRFSQGRCFLAGDAAHIHSPAGGQGMNTGIQDGYNLAWKLALALKNGADASLLETYNEERLENAKRLLRTTDRLFQLGASAQWPLPFLRGSVLPSVARSLLRFDKVKKFAFPLLSQIGIQYRRDALSQHDGDENFDVKAGDRMPYFLVDGVSVYDRLRQSKFHLLTFSDVPGDAQTPPPELGGPYADWVDFHAFPLDSKGAEIFGADRPFRVLLRPDNYIGVISPDASLDGIKAYLHALVAPGGESADPRVRSG